jgi:hypothetical protein
MGVIRGGLLRSAVDSGGLESPFRPGWTPGDAHGHRLEIYGSGGWVFESPRARWQEPCTTRAFCSNRPLDLLTFGSHPSVPKVSGEKMSS